VNELKRLPVPVLDITIAAIAVLAIAAYLVLWALGIGDVMIGNILAREIPLLVALAFAVPLLWRTVIKIARFELTADLLAAVSIESNGVKYIICPS
jgi:hypothetical protein